MSETADEVESAVFTALEPLVGRLSFDSPYRGGKPLISLGRTSIRDWSTGIETGEQLLTVHVWSGEGGEAETARLTAAIRARLGEGLDLGNGRLVRTRLDFEETGFAAELSAHHGLLRFRAWVEESPA